MLSVKQYQKNLKHYYAYYTGAVDGIKGSGTTSAIKRFQKGHGLTQDGIYGAKTDAKLVSRIKTLQGIVGTTKDGIVGTNTINGIKKKQKAWGLTQDGIAGTKFWAKANGSGSAGSSGATSSAWNGSSHFEKTEMKCKCGGKYCNGYPADISTKLMNILESLRSYYGKPITITSGLRCATHNANVGGVSNSAHKYGKAADIYIPGICGSASGRNQVVAKAYALGAAYSYANTKGMGNVVHINV